MTVLLVCSEMLGQLTVLSRNIPVKLVTSCSRLVANLGQAVRTQQFLRFHSRDLRKIYIVFVIFASRDKNLEVCVGSK